MAITRAQVSTPAGLAAWLNENAGAFLSGVSRVGAQEIYRAADLDGNIIFNFTANNFTAYRRNEANPISSNGGNSYFGTTSIIMCDNGIILDTSYNYNVSRKFGVLITKTNDGKIACIFSYGGTATTNDNYLYTQLQHVALGDSTTMSTTTTFTPEAGQQTSLVPFSTNADIEEVSYTPNAYWIAMSANYSMGIGKFRMGGDTFISNGYWAIKDNQSV